MGTGAARARAWLGSAVFLLIAPGTIAGLLPILIARGDARVAPPARALVVGGWLLVVSAGLALLESFARFAWRGLGTPAPILPTRHLVVSGLYRHVRNPMYIAVLTVIVGQAMRLGSPAVGGYGVLVALGFHGFVVLYEEPTLRATHGASFVAYCTNVRRWRPRLRPWMPSADAPATPGTPAAGRSR